jgi:cysteine desulfurase/selenocysteine lyase
MAMTPAEVRELFPALSRCVWLNAAASSPLCTPVAAAMKAHLDETQQAGDVGFPRWLAFKEALRERTARFLGATASEVAFTPSTSFGFHVVAELLLARGITEVLCVEGEFPSTTVPLLARGLTLRVARRRSDGSTPVEDLRSALRPTTGAVAVSAVQYASGYRVDLPALAADCRAKGLALCVNAAQALGQVPLDVRRLDASFLCATSHKWLFGGYGTGLLYARRDLLDAGPLPLAGWLSVRKDALWDSFPALHRVDDERGFTVRGAALRREASALELGTHGFSGLYGLDAALGIHEAVGIETTQRHVRNLQALLREGLRDQGFTPNAPDQGAHGSGICVVPVSGGADEVVRALLREAGIATTARGGGLRVSTHVFNDERDVRALLEALRTLKVSPPQGAGP